MDCTFNTDEGIFNFRVGAIIIHDDKILMGTDENSNYYFSIGGRVKFGEKIDDAVVREVFEETGWHLEIDRMGFVHENFFCSSSYR